MYREHTPIERHTVNGRTVFVKRDDLFAMPPAPPLAKLRGLRKILAKAADNGATLVGCFEASASNIGAGLAAAVSEFPSIKCVVAFPQVKNRPAPLSAQRAAELGAELLPVPSNFVAICYRQASKQILERGGVMMPFGFECEEAVESVELEAATIPNDQIEGGTLVVCCGSGVTLAGIVRGLPTLPSKIVGVSIGRSHKNIEKCLARFCDVPDQFELHQAPYKYSQPSQAECPFPCNQFYDLKAWEHLVNHVGEYTNPILMWNVGANMV